MRKLDAGEIASSQAVRVNFPFLGAFGGCGFAGVVCGRVASGRAGTGYEVGDWGERHGALE